MDKNKCRALAVIFPGIGYHTDKPLLYFAKKLALSFGCEILEVNYGGFPSGIKGSPEKMKEVFTLALSQTEDLLKDTDFSAYDRLIFISKSLGTAVAAAYAGRHQLPAGNIFYTPVEATFPLICREGIVFHGTRDSWADTAAVQQGCREKGLPLYLIEGADHSLETGDVDRDLRNLREIMEQSAGYLRKVFS